MVAYRTGSDRIEIGDHESKAKLKHTKFCEQNADGTAQPMLTLFLVNGCF